MKSILLATGLVLAATPAFAADSQNWLIGAWKLVSATQNGKEYLGPNPRGQVLFDADGQFSDILLRSDIKKFKVNNRAEGTAEENAEVVKGSIAYFGTYTLNGDTLKLHIDSSTFPNWDGTDQTRIVHLTGNQFTWENAAASAGGGGVKLVFQRVQ